ncbi:hypothetical protein SVIOM342S_03476 [Streptomyces violaceorubidus]
MPSSVAPLLSWISSSDTMSGDFRWCTIASACAAKVSSDGSKRFSTLYVATASSRALCGRVDSRSVPPRSRAPISPATSV